MRKMLVVPSFSFCDDNFMEAVGAEMIAVVLLIRVPIPCP